MDTTSRIARLRRHFTRIGNPRRANGERAYLKSDLHFFGVDKAGIRAAARELLADHPELTRQELLSLVDALWTTRDHELWEVGIDLLDRRSALLQARDLRFVESLLRKTHTWAHVDWLAITVAGALVSRYTTCARALDRWSRDPNFWIRRSALLALLRPLRDGDGDFDRFARYASTMIDEREFFIRKAIGWVLREVGKKRPNLTKRFLEEHVDVVSGLTLREGAKYLPPASRERLLRMYAARTTRGGQR